MMASNGRTSPPSPGTAPLHDESQTTMTLMTGIANPEGMGNLSQADLEAMDATAGGGGMVLSQTSLLVLVAFVFAVGAILLMRQQHADPAASKEIQDVEARIEQALAKLSSPQTMSENDGLRPDNINALFRDANTIASMFTTDATTRQVPLEFLKKNPFEIPAVANVIDAAPQIPNDTLRQEKLRKLQVEFKDLQLQSVMQGRVPVAVISGSVVQVGQSIGSFKVKEISPLGVILQCGGQNYTLNMQHENKEEKTKK